MRSSPPSAPDEEGKETAAGKERSIFEEREGKKGLPTKRE